MYIKDIIMVFRIERKWLGNGMVGHPRRLADKDTPTVISKGARVVCLDQIFSSIDTNVRPLLGQF